MGAKRSSQAFGARGITLLEIILAMVLLGVLLALAMPSLTSSFEARGLPESCERLRSLIHLTRTAAMRDGVRYRLAFPGAPDPDDPRAKQLVEAVAETQQPFVEREEDPLNKPGAFVGADLYYDVGSILMPGVRCVAIRRVSETPDSGFFFINNKWPFAGPEINTKEAPMDVITFNPDGTCEGAVFTLTNMGFDEEPTESDIGRIVNVLLDGRTGQTWFQRPWRNREVELMQQYRAEPVLHVDFVKTDEITEDNILHIQMQVARLASNE